MMNGTHAYWSYWNLVDPLLCAYEACQTVHVMTNLEGILIVSENEDYEQSVIRWS